MGISKVEITIAITLETAAHIGTGLGLAQLLDDRTVQGPHAQDTRFELPYLPGASLKGRLRYHARQLSAALGWKDDDRNATEAALFGFDHQAGSLMYSDLHLDREAFADLLDSQNIAPLQGIVRNERSFVSLSRERRVALEGRLFRLELAERDLVFRGDIQGYLRSDVPKRDIGLLLAALRDLSHLGGHKGRGLGRCSAQILTVLLDTTEHQWSDLIKGLPCLS
jgi:CRISPR/Cas system CSM-associated protein Csm3 (group 7 of RAMP superfamily)